MRTNVLFYTFLVIFAVTAVVTLLGVVQVVEIEGKYLTALVTAFLVELAVAVILLFQKTDFSERPDLSVIASIDHSAQMVDRISGQILGVVEGRRPAPDEHAYRMIIRRSGGEIGAYQRIGVITGEQLQALPEAERKHITTHEKSLQRLKNAWDQLYPERVRADGSIDPEVEARLQRLVAEMKTDLVGILDFLERQGLHLDDHYQHVRSVIAQYEPEASQPA
jgi:hypothetical protein